MTNMLKILLVDDSATMLRLTESALQKHFPAQGIQLYLQEAVNGRDALAKLGKENFDLIISDWEMPVMTGDKLLLEVKATSAWANIPFLMVTARTDVEAITTAIQAGVSDYLVKPFTPLDLIAKVQRLVKKAERRKFARYEDPANTQLLVRYEEGSLEGRVIDISMGGLLGRFPVPAHSLITRTVSLDILVTADESTSIADIKCVVLRIEAEFQPDGNRCKMAFRFLDLTSEQVNRIHGFVTALETRAPEPLK
ncbi:MAG: response regulator [Deltaproteobacteria bacterium]|nr:response regulator [Deltaproteobacteria bacterium]